VPLIVPAVELATVVHNGSHANIDLAYGATVFATASGSGFPRRRGSPPAQGAAGHPQRARRPCRLELHFPDAPSKVYFGLGLDRKAVTEALARVESHTEILKTYQRLRARHVAMKTCCARAFTRPLQTCFASSLGATCRNKSGSTMA
jgi:hypothetical protein